MRKIFSGLVGIALGGSMLLGLLGPAGYVTPGPAEDLRSQLGIAALFLLAGLYYLLAGILGLRSAPAKPNRPAAPDLQQKITVSTSNTMNEFTSFSDADLVSESDKAWGRGDTERLATIKAERARRAALANAGMKTWVKMLCYLLTYIIGTNLAAAFGVGAVWGIMLGVAISATLTPLIDTAVGNQMRRRINRQQG